MGFLGEKTLTRRRLGPTTMVAGVAVPGAAVDTTFTGSVQPASGRDRQVLPEGVRTSDARKIYCPRFTLRTDDQHADPPLPADLVIIPGRGTFRVVHVDDDHELIPHDHVVVIRTKEGGA